MVAAAFWVVLAGLLFVACYLGVLAYLAVVVVVMVNLDGVVAFSVAAAAFWDLACWEVVVNLVVAVLN